MHALLSARPTMAVLTALGLTAASVGLSKLAQDSGIWSWALLIIVGLFVVGTIARRLKVPGWGVSIIQVLIAFMVVSAVTVPSSMAAGLIPTPQTFSELGRLAPQGFEVMRDERAPLPASPGVRLLLLTMVAVSTVAAEALAVGLAAPAAAGVAILLLYVVPLSAMPTPGAWPWFAITAVPFALMLACGEARRRDSWMPSRAQNSRGFDALAIAVGVIVALVASFVVPSFLPRSSEERFHIGAGRGSGSNVITVGNPMFDLGNSLREQGKQPVLDYVSTDKGSHRIRQAVVDTYDGTTFTPTTGKLARSQQVQKSMPAPPSEGPKAQMDVKLIAESTSTFLPTPQNPLKVEVEGKWLYDASTLNIIGDGQTADTGLKYKVTFAPRSPSPDALRSAGKPQLPADQLARWTEVPSSVPSVVKTTAVKVAGRGDAFTQATRLQQYFREGNGFKYSLKVPDATDGQAIALFLRRRSGYCVHYSTTMALMARSLGIPARVVAGFLPGNSRAGVHRVTAEDAHAWPEIYFEGHGWVAFEPTAGGNVTGAPEYTQDGESNGDETAGESPAAEPTSTPTDGQESIEDDSEGFKPTVVPVPDSEASTDDEDDSKQKWSWFLNYWMYWTALFVALGLVLLLLGVLLVVPRLLRAAWLRKITQQASSDGDLMEVQWMRLREELADVGIVWPSSATLSEVQHGLTVLLPQDAHVPLDDLCESLDRARYAGTVAQGDVEAADAARAQIVAAAHAPLRKSWSLSAKLFPTWCRHTRQPQPWPERSTVSGAAVVPTGK